MTRCAKTFLLLSLFIVLAAPLFFASPSEAATTVQLRERLATVTTRLADLRLQLAKARAILWPALESGNIDAIESSRAAIRWLKPAIRRLNRRAGRLRWLVNHPMQPTRTGSWMPVIRAAAARNHISSAGLRRLMIMESGGRVRAVGGGGLYVGLFQYCRGTWNGSWNTFRRFGIYNGGAQIWATANAIRRGWGPRMWPNTYPRAF